MNGPVKMYPLRQIVRHDLPIQLPKCMYKVGKIHTPAKTHATVTTENSRVQGAPDISHQNNSELAGMAALEQRQEYILRQLEDLKQQMMNIRKSINTNVKAVVVAPPLKTAKITTAVNPHDIEALTDIVINASPSNPPFSLILLRKLFGKSANFNIKVYTHSSLAALTENAVELQEQLKKVNLNPELPTISIRLIWKDVGVNLFEVLLSSQPLIGECNLLRFLARTILPSYDECSYEVDALMDLSYLIIRSRTKTERLGMLQTVNKKLGKSKFLLGDDLSVVDIALYSAIKQAAAVNEVQVNLNKWMQRCETVQ